MMIVASLLIFDVLILIESLSLKEESLDNLGYGIGLLSSTYQNFPLEINLDFEYLSTVNIDYYSRFD